MVTERENRPGLIGVFGGTFDPIHSGHLQSVESLLQELNFQAIYLLPSATPPHRAPTSVRAKDRLEMVKLAIAGNNKLLADDRESRQTGKSFTIDTLKSFRTQFPDHTIAFIAGMDAYLNMPNWKQWQDFLDLSHIIVMKRPGYPKPESSWGENVIANTESELLTSVSGKIYFACSKLVDISSTKIRQRLQAHQDVKALLPDCVINYIKLKQLYAYC